MNDFYMEELVERKKKGWEPILKIVMILVTAALFLLCFLSLNMLVFIAAIIMLVMDLFVFPLFDIEWEYTYVNGEVDIDRICKKTKRKRMGSYNVSNMEIICPIHSHRLDQYQANSKITSKDYSSGDSEREKKVYAMLVTGKEGFTKVIFEPTEAILKDMRMKAPRKVFFD